MQYLWQTMINFGDYNQLKVLRFVEFGAYLDDGGKGILLPKRFVPKDLKEGEIVEVFAYHDGEGKAIATTQKPYGKVGDIVKLKAVGVTNQGAFMDMGLMKDIFVPRSQQLNPMMPNGEYIVKIYLDEKTGRIAATQKFNHLLSNDNLSVNEKDIVKLLCYRRTDIGYVMIINNKHTGVLHFSDIFKSIHEGMMFEGYVKKIYENNNVDVALGQSGYQRVNAETDKIITLLKKNNGFLPYHDKSNAEEIYEVFGISKKTFKMAVGNLYKQRKLDILPEGIKLINE